MILLIGALWVEGPTAIGELAEIATQAMIVVVLTEKRQFDPGAPGMGGGPPRSLWDGG